jgi:LmbE family N-acetylglucosaminyl deacetylase
MRVLVFGAHPDDMEIGMGGTIAKHTAVGDDVLLVVATVPSQREERIREAYEAARVLGARLELLDIPPEEIGFNRRTTHEFDRLFSTLDPHLAYTHWNQDSHQDHNAVARTVIAAARKNRCSLLMYEQTIPGGVVPGGFKAQSFVDISDFIDRKTQSILIHRTQIAMNGGDWWLEGLRGRAMYRGYQINVRFAEAFEVVKEIDVHFSNKPARVVLSRDARRHDGRNQVEDGNARDERSVNQVGKTNVPGRVPER